MLARFIFILALFNGAIQSQLVFYTRYPDQMEPSFVGRINGITVSDTREEGVLYVVYGVGNETGINTVTQRFGATSGHHVFPPRPTETIYAPNKILPMGSRDVHAVVASGSSLFVASLVDNINIILSYWHVNSDLNNKTEMYIGTYGVWQGTDPLFQTGNNFKFDGSTTYISSLALSNFENPKLALVIGFTSSIFKILIFSNVSSYDYNLERIIDAPGNGSMRVGKPAVVDYSFGSANTSFLMVYSYLIDSVKWGMIAMRLAGDQREWKTMNLPFESHSEMDIKLAPLTGPSRVVMTMSYKNGTHSVLTQGVYRVEDDIMRWFEITAGPVNVNYLFEANVLSNGEAVTVWTNDQDLTTIYGRAIKFPDTPFYFTFPASASTNDITRLTIAPISFATFAVTQTVSGGNPAAFVNFYVLSSCSDNVTTANENCVVGEGCQNCMCMTGWYSIGQGYTCETKCGDNIRAGNESCDNVNDTNCNNCTCTEGYSWSTEELLCTLPGLSVTGPPEPFDTKLVAVIVCVPVGAGLAIFFGVYFGRKKANANKSKKASIADVPLDESNLSGKYSGIDPTSAQVYTSTHSSVMSPPSRSSDRLRVPYKEIVFHEEIGSGAYGKVFVGEWQRTKVALKINTLARGAEFEREAELMVDLRPHPNVVQMLGVSSDGPYPVMILEFCDGGSLDTKLFDPSEPFPVAEQLKTVSGIAKGLYHLHRNQIVHRDLAARNILLNFNQPKISDFGLSRLVNDTQKGTTRSNVGPIRWMSPESLKNQTYSTKSDVWSFGIVVYEIAARKEPHAEADQMAIGLQIRDSGITPKIPEDCDPCLAELMQKCWHLDPEQRPTMEEICDILDNYMH